MYSILLHVMRLYTGEKVDITRGSEVEDVSTHSLFLFFFFFFGFTEHYRRLKRSKLLLISNSMFPFSKYLTCLVNKKKNAVKI